MIDGEIADDELLFDPIQKLRADVYDQVFKTVLNRFRKRFKGYGKIAASMACLDPRNFEELDGVSHETFEFLSNKILQFNAKAKATRICEELLDVASKFEYLKKGLTEYTEISLEVINNDYENIGDVDSEFCRPNVTTEHISTCKNVAISY